MRHTALPSPGSEDQLRRLTGRVFSQQLDRSKPLWELWLVQGLEQNRFALLTKTHHALVDGVSGVDIATVLFDVKPVPEPAAEETEWAPSPEPSTVQLVSKGLTELAATPFKLGARLAGAVQHPEPTARRIGDSLEALGEVAWNFANRWARYLSTA